MPHSSVTSYWSLESLTKFKRDFRGQDKPKKRSCLGLGVDVGAVVEQQFHDAGLSGSGGVMQWCLASLSHASHVGAFVQQIRHHALTADERSHVQRSQTTLTTRTHTYWHYRQHERTNGIMRTSIWGRSTTCLLYRSLRETRVLNFFRTQHSSLHAPLIRCRNG